MNSVHRSDNGFSLEGCIACKPEKRNEKIKKLHSITANLKLDQDVANEEKENRQLLILWPNLQTVKIRRYGSLIDIDPCRFSEWTVKHFSERWH